MFYGVKLYSLLLLRIDRRLKENAKISFGNKFIERLIFKAFVPMLYLVEVEDISLPLVFNSYISLLCRARIPFLITYTWLLDEGKAVVVGVGGDGDGQRGRRCNIVSPVLTFAFHAFYNLD